MREAAFSIIDLNGKSWPQLLDVDRPVAHLLPNLVDSLGMPRELNYVLIPKWANLPLDSNHTLAEYRIPGGAELFLRPLRDHLLKMLLDKLYDEAKDEIKNRLIDLAKDKLKKILQLDPTYPDPLHLKEQAGILPQPPLTKGGTQQPQFKSQPRPRSSTGCIIAGVLGGGAVLLVVGAIVAAVLFKVFSGNLVGNRDEPVLGTGDVQITLRWDAPVDLDLHVIDPSGEEIWYGNRTSISGGNLDVDANAGCNSMMTNPVENVFWPYGGAPGGQYQVSVVYFTNCGYSGPVSYQVTVKQANHPAQVFNGTVNNVSESQPVTSFKR